MVNPEGVALFHILIANNINHSGFYIIPMCYAIIMSTLSYVCVPNVNTKFRTI